MSKTPKSAKGKNSESWAENRKSKGKISSKSTFRISHEAKWIEPNKSWYDNKLKFS